MELFCHWSGGDNYMHVMLQWKPYKNLLMTSVFFLSVLNCGTNVPRAFVSLFE